MTPQGAGHLTPAAVDANPKRINRLAARGRLLLSRLKLGRVRKFVVAVVGGSVVAVGIAMVVLPGPAFLVIPLGVVILAMEFLWARRWLKWTRSLFQNGRTKVRPKPLADKARQTLPADDET